MSPSKLVLLCDRYDSAEKEFSRGGTAELSLSLSAAKKKLLAEDGDLLKEARRLALTDCSNNPAFGCLSYYTAWLTQREGFRY